MPQRTLPLVLALLSTFLYACGGGGSSSTSVVPTFTSTPVTAAEEGTGYSYALAATTPNSSAVTFALTSGPMGATLSGNTVSWTPTHDQSRVANSFTVTATAAGGGSATQTWSVTPNGTIQIVDMVTYWTPSGPMDIPTQWLPNVPYPAVLAPQKDGTFLRLQGAANPDGSFSIPDVPGGHYWLLLNAVSAYWTATSSFDAGFEVVGRPIKTTAPTTTTINYSLSGLDPLVTNDVITVKSDLRNSDLESLTTGFGIPGIGPVGATTVNFGGPMTTILDYSPITSLMFLQYEPETSGSLNLYALGPELTLNNVSITNGGVNNFSGTLSPSPQSSLALNVKGTAWANSFQNIAPGSSPPNAASFSVSAQPYVTDRYVPAADALGGSDLALLAPGRARIGIFPFPGPVACSLIGGGPFLPGGISDSVLPPIVTDQDFGSIPFGDPFPSTWPRIFQFCEQTSVALPRPGSATLTDNFVLTQTLASELPTSPVTPALSPVGNPTVNGSSLFTIGTTLNTTTVTLNWAAPTTGKPFGYYVNAFVLTTLQTGETVYTSAGRFATAQTSVTLPEIGSGFTYVFIITAVADGNANIETSPNRSKLPRASASVISAPITISSTATATPAAQLSRK